MADVREIEKIAAGWLAKRDSGRWSDADEEALARWLEDADHYVEFIRLEAVWQQANRLKALGAGVPAGTVPAPARWHLASSLERFSPASGSQPVRAGTVGKRARLRRAALWAVAATLVLAVALLYWQAGPLGRDRHITPIGGLASISMQDGSTIVLNTDSRIEVAEAPAQRRVVLDRGEAFFDVTPDPARPFVVIAGDQRVTVLGTKFAVRRLDDDQLNVAVIEGRVRVEPPATGDLPLPPAELTAGTLARSSGQGVLVETTTVRDVEERLSWRNGFLSFRETPLARAAEEFNRYNRRQLVIDDPRLAHIRIGGHFRSGNVDAFVRLLEQDFSIHVERRGETIVLKERGG